MGLSRYAYNTVVHWSRHRRLYTKNCHIGPSHRTWVKSQSYGDKLHLLGDQASIWGERKFCRAIVRLGMLLRGIPLGNDRIVPANIIDEAIDQALIARNEVIKRNTEHFVHSVHALSFRSYKALRHTITVRAQNFSKVPWNRFYVSYLHTPEMQSQVSQTTCLAT